MNPRGLVIGASGQLGRALCAVLRDTHEVIEGVHRLPRTDQVCIDLGKPAEMIATIQALKPARIFIAGAFCNVDRAETDHAECFAVNMEGPRAIAAYAQAHGCTVVYYSTDTVFDGTKERYIESDPACPMNVYSQSKAQGEAAIRTLLPTHHLILRTAWLYGPDEAKRNFILRLVEQLRAGQRVVVPADQWGSPTYTEDLAAATRFLVERGQSGTFHATGPDFLDRASLARRICASFDLDARLVAPAPTSQMGQAALRPLRIQLDCQKLRALGIGEFRGINAGLEALRHASANDAETAPMAR